MTLAVLVVGLSGACRAFYQGTDADGDGYYAGFDCDDEDGSVHPDHPELCDGQQQDNDCDGRPDGTDLPVLDDFADGLDEGWFFLAGSEEDLEQTAEGLRPTDDPVAIARELGVDCWDSYRLMVGWAFEDQEAFEDASFVLELMVMAGSGSSDNEAQPSQGYLLRWTRDGTARLGQGSSYELFRLTDRGQERLNYSSAEPDSLAYHWASDLALTARVSADSSEINVDVSSFLNAGAVMHVSDDNLLRQLSGGAVVAVQSASDGVLTGAWIEPR